MKKYYYLIITTFIFMTCTPEKDPELVSPISDITEQNVIAELIEKHGDEHAGRIERGVTQAASLWRLSDGTAEDFIDFCKQRFIGCEDELNMVFSRISRNFEYLFGYMNRIALELRVPLHLDIGPLHPIDQIFGSYNPAAHLRDDLFNNKLAFLIVLNFPHYTLEEKNELGGEWCPIQWARARLGDYFTARVPADYVQEYSRVNSDAGMYIAQYNIYAGELIDDDMNTFFPEGMNLLAHWNIRDEIKANYGLEDGLEKQEILYKVMLRIINQDIPEEVVNTDKYQWNPYSNIVYKDGEKIEFTPEKNVRYQHLLNNFNALHDMDPFHTELDTYIKRSFDGNMEIPQEEVEELFREYIGSPQVKKVASLIEQRLGRKLRPFDIWYDGFKARAAIPEKELDRITKKRYPDADAFNKDLPMFLRKLGFPYDKAEFIASKIEVDPARGSGHAWRASMRNKPSHLRTRIGADGMDYKGYNIAIHEFGHNVEQTISVYMVEDYLINGIPNTAFTEALAFMFQIRDLELLGIKPNDPMKKYYDVLDIFWGNYEIMGVSLVDMEVWKWMYDNPDASADELKEATINIAKDIWNEYYEPVFGVGNIPILAIYSHMIQSPLYLSAYPYGHLIEFQLEQYIEDKDFAEEVIRMFSIGRYTPKHWMEKAIGDQISNRPVLEATDQAVRKISEL